MSTEITGYAASTLAWLFRATGDERYLAAAREAAAFLVSEAWMPEMETFPFELPARFTYFFDTGIIIRGLLAVWRETGDGRLVEVSSAAGRAMMRDFAAGRCHHPILHLPGKRPAAREARWSRQPGCYQLKAALAWREVAEITRDGEMRAAFEDALSTALASHEDFLPGTDDRQGVMDRLHAYCYFLEGLAAFPDWERCAKAYREGLERVSFFLREIAPEFARSDVYAQLLRARLLGADAATVDEDAAAQEAAELATFQLSSADRRTDGAWTFGRRNGAISPHVNPVSTAFAIQALGLWREFEAKRSVSCQPPI